MRKELEEIKKIRVSNNDLWLAILDIALRVDPEHTKDVLQQIRQNDRDITEYMLEIVEED